jgi:hypothetical protein
MAASPILLSDRLKKKNAEITSVLKLLLLGKFLIWPSTNILFIFVDLKSKMALMEGQSIKLFGKNNLK